MKLKTLAIASALVLTSGIALADQGHRDHQGHASCGKGKFDKTHVQERRSEHFEQHQEKLHTMLQLNANQENAWKTYQAQIKPKEKTTKPDHEAFAKQNTLQRLDQMDAWDKERDSRSAERAKAIKAFYAQLNDAQKKVFDENAFPHPHKHRS